MYPSRKCPDILLDDIRDYKPKQPSGWDGIQDRVCKFYDDGHASKLIRALAHGQQICKPYEQKEEFRIKHDDWLQMVSKPTGRTVGFDPRLHEKSTWPPFETYADTSLQQFLGTYGN